MAMGTPPQTNAERFGDNGGIGKVEAEAAIRLVVFDAEHPERAEHLKDLMRREFFGFLPLLYEGIDFILHKADDGVAELFVLFRQLQGVSSYRHHPNPGLQRALPGFPADKAY